MESKEWIIKQMGIEDLDEVFNIESSSSLQPWSKNAFSEEIRNPHSHCFIFEMKGIPKCRVTGYICFRNFSEDSELLNICVHPQYRRMGIGKKLMQFYLDFSREPAIKTFYLEVNITNQAAIHLYQFFSYQSSGMRKKFYQGKFDALLMIKKA